MGTSLLHAIQQFAIKRKGLVLVASLVTAFGWAAIAGPQGLQTLFERHAEIRELEEGNAALEADNERRRERIERLTDSRSEQEMEIRRQLKLTRPGETTFFLPGRSSTDSPDEEVDGESQPEENPSSDARE